METPGQGAGGSITADVTVGLLEAPQAFERPFPGFWVGSAQLMSPWPLALGSL